MIVATPHDTHQPITSATMRAGAHILSAKDVPYPAGLVFNAGVAKFKGRYVMVFRNDPGNLTEKILNGHSRMGIAFSADDRILSPPRLNCMRGR